MEKESTSNASKNPKPKPSPLGFMGFNDKDTPWLIGGIVEKGFEKSSSAPSSAPRPTVLPFPVARHRSHGPHWAPKVDDRGEEDEFEEEGEFDGMERAADVANPIPRRETKQMDFSGFREMMKNGGGKKKEARLGGNAAAKSTDVKSVDDLGRRMDIDDVKEESMTMDDKDMIAFRDREAGVLSGNSVAMLKDSMMAEVRPERETGLSKGTERFLEMQHLPVTEGGGGSDLQSQIDAENRERLSKMSPDEIAEERAEILQKLNPKLIDALKRRGQAKVTKQKFSMSDDTDAHSSQRQENLSKLAATSDSSLSHKPAKVVDRDAPKVEENKQSTSTTEQSGRIWDAWRDRVEGVRDIRFSLEGTVVSTDSTSVLDNGNVSSQSGYSTDNVSERDMLRTEGDPGAAGYTIKEAVVLTRSLIPSQRALALHLIATILDKAITNICQNQVGCAPKSVPSEGSVDWEAIWAFALGPEPELVFSLRMCLDDNHNSVVLACAKAIQCALSSEMNELILDTFEKTPTFLRDVCTAPVFRSRPDINSGFLRGGFWKYNTKHSNISPQFGEESMGDKPEEERTIKDDIVVTGQDVAAGLVRMGIVPRICYLLETDATASLEERLISILIAVARHSPTCAAEVVNCDTFLQTVANRFALKEHMDINPCKIKYVMLFKVLARVDKKNCFKFKENGFIQKMTWHLYRPPLSLDKWLKSGKEACKLSSALLVEQLRLWKVCIQYGYLLPDISTLFTSVCIWLSLPSFQKLIENDVVNEYCAITKEAYLLFDALACKLPNFYSYMHRRTEDTDLDEDGLSWNHFAPIIDIALEWIEVKSIPYFSEFHRAKDNEKSNLPNSQVNSVLWVVSSVLSMLSSSLKAVIPEDMAILQNQPLDWLPNFVTRIGLKIIKNGYFGFSGLGDKDNANHLSENDSLVEHLSNLRLSNGQELAISSVCCLQGLVQLASCVDKLIQHANLDIHKVPSKFTSLSREDRILSNGIIKSSVVEIRSLLTTSIKLINNEWLWIQGIEKFGRGGPAPGVGVGWGATGGGYWSIKTLLAQQDARLLICLYDVPEISFVEDASENGETGRTFEMLNCALAACLIAGPANSLVIDQLLNFISRVSVLKYLDIGIRQFLGLKKGFKTFGWNYGEEEYLSFANVLATHFRKRWLVTKKKKKDKRDKHNISSQTSREGSRSLETIHEEPKTTAKEPTSLVQEWAHQRLHLPAHWFLSSLSTIPLEKDMHLPSDLLEVSKAGLFFLLGLEAMPTFLNSESRCVFHCVPIVWKLHALSVTLLSGMGVLEDDKSRDVFEALQNIYGQSLDEKKVDNLLLFESDIHENYSTFIDNLVDQFAADSYGDLVFGRQVAIYLHRSVETSVRLAAWKALSNTHVLELLPPPDKCLTNVVGYLEPVEDDERILEAYEKSWVSGALDKAVIRGSVASLVALHHLSSFIFNTTTGNREALRSKLVKSLLRDCSNKKQHEGMMVKLICYKKPDVTVQPESDIASTLPGTEIEKRLKLLKEICKGFSALVTVLEKLESAIKRECP